MTDISSIGINSMLAYQSALTLSSQNLSNANTPYYCRRMINFTEDQFGYGVNIGDARRMSDEVINQFDRASISRFSSSDAYLSQLKSFETIFDKSEISIGKSITDSLAAIEKLSTNPASVPGRSLYLGQLGELTHKFQNVTMQVSQAKKDTLEQIKTNIDQANTILQNLASVNAQLSSAGSNNSPELLDRRDGLMSQLSTFFDFTPEIDKNGIASLSLNNGMSILAGNQVKTLTTMPDPSNAQNILIAVNDGSHTSSIMNFISSGQLVGLTQFENNTLNPTQHALDRLALGLAQGFNQQNKLGIDINGTLGANIFTDINNTNAVNSRLIGNANNIGASNMSVTITDVGQLAASDYKLTMGAGNTFALTRLSDSVVVNTGVISAFPQNISVDGFIIAVNNGTFGSGDQYIISPTNGGANNFSLISNDPSKLAMGWPVMTTLGSQAPGSTGTISVTGITDTTNSAFSIPKNLNPPITVVFLTATSYQLQSTDTSQLIEGPISYDPTLGANIFPTPGGYDPGYRVSLAGANQAGDNFLIGYNTNPADNSNGLALAGLYQKSLLNQGTLTWGGAYASLSGNISMEASRASSDYDTANVIKKQASARRDAISGISLEEETMNLGEYQQYYQASAQILASARTIFDTIIQMTRR